MRQWSKRSLEEFMHYDNVAFFGMHFFWWFFWIILWVVFFSMLRPVSHKHWRQMRETPIDILNRRLANGEINEQEHDSRKSIIERNIIVEFADGKSVKT